MERSDEVVLTRTSEGNGQPQLILFCFSIALLALLFLPALTGCLTTGKTGGKLGGQHSSGPLSSEAYSVSAEGRDTYDRAMFAAIQARWFALLEQHTIPGAQSGTVELQYKLYDDGTVRNFITPRNTANEVLAQYCKMAVELAAPFGPWPEEKKYRLKRSSIIVGITFVYH